jgi:hypothetical protein
VDEADRWIALYTKLVSSTENALREAQVINLTQAAEMQLIQAHLATSKTGSRSGVYVVDASNYGVDWRWKICRPVDQRRRSGHLTGTRA